MKRRIIVALAVALSVLPSVRLLHADEGKAGREDGKKWAEKLGLSDDQVKKMESVRDSERSEMKPLEDKRHDLVEKLEGQIKSKASDADLTATLNALAANRESFEGVLKKYMKSRQDILTPTQQANMVVAHMNMRHKHMGKGKKGSGEKPGPKEDDGN